MNILEQLISGAVEKSSNGESNEDSDGDVETESEEGDQAGDEEDQASDEEGQAGDEEDQASDEEDQAGDEEDQASDEEDQTGGEEEQASDEEDVAQLLSDLSCRFCNKLFSTKGNKEHHEKYLHKRDPASKSAYFCKLVDTACEKAFSSKTSLRYHQLRTHGKTLHCDKCQKEFTDWKEFVKHRRSERGNPELPTVANCTMCKVPITSQHLKRHMREVHKIPIKNPLKEPAEKHHSCPHCGKEFKRVENMQRHVEEAHTVTFKEKSKCEHCEKSFTLERNLKLHIKRAHAQSPFFSTFNCYLCEKSFKQKAHLKRHQKEKHSDEEMFSCPSCDKSFARESNQRRHSKNCERLRK